MSLEIWRLLDDAATLPKSPFEQINLKAIAITDTADRPTSEFDIPKPCWIVSPMSFTSKDRSEFMMFSSDSELQKRCVLQQTFSPESELNIRSSELNIRSSKLKNPELRTKDSGTVPLRFWNGAFQTQERIQNQ